MAYNCHNSGKSSASLHKFPSDEKVRKIWIGKIRRKNWTPSQHSRLCSQHFTHDCFEQDLVAMQYAGWKPKRLSLKAGAIPIIFDYEAKGKTTKRASSGSTGKTRRRGAYEKRRRTEVSEICLYFPFFYYFNSAIDT